MAPESDWANAGLAMFADVSKMEFERLEFAQIGTCVRRPRGSGDAIE
jgi:hypothetical protein